MPVTRRDADFTSRGTRCAAWLYRSEDVANPPVVVMAHGFGCERDWRLPAFAEHFADRGLATLVFDYRRFGASEGEPRNLITPKGHVRDWMAAIEHARSLDGVDGDRVALWGSSFSGGHTVTAAARAGNVDAVVAQVPFSDGIRTVLHLVRAGGLDYLTSAVVAGSKDLFRKVTLRSPHYIPIAGEPDEFAALNRPGTLDGYESINDGEWDNRCAGRILLTVLAYRPIAAAGQVDCPTLVVEAEEDNIITGSTVDRLVNRLDDVERVRYSAGHFDVYTGGTFDAVVERETAFLERHLLE
jgi:pimeloyl-ACP methyl ester carboxylesterase